MKTILKKETTKRYRYLMDSAIKNSNRFITGYPLGIVKYGVYPDGKTSFVTFETERGIEETYNGDCLASAISDTDKIIEFKLN